MSTAVGLRRLKRESLFLIRLRVVMHAHNEVPSRKPGKLRFGSRPKSAAPALAFPACIFSRGPYNPAFRSIPVGS
jgi:hypothetical protein